MNDAEKERQRQKEERQGILMPLYKGSPKSGKGNQGAQWGDTGSAGNIKHNPSSMDANIAGPKSGANNNRHGRNKSIGRGRSEVRRSVNPE